MPAYKEENGYIHPEHQHIFDLTQKHLLSIASGIIVFVSFFIKFSIERGIDLFLGGLALQLFAANVLVIFFSFASSFFENERCTAQFYSNKNEQKAEMFDTRASRAFSSSITLMCFGLAYTAVFIPLNFLAWTNKGESVRQLVANHPFLIQAIVPIAIASLALLYLYRRPKS